MSDLKVLYVCGALVMLAAIFTMHACIVDSAKRCADLGGYYNANTAKCGVLLR